MKQLCFLTAAVLTAGVMTAQVQFSALPGHVRMPQKVNLTEAVTPQRIVSSNVTVLPTPKREVHMTGLTAKDKYTGPKRMAPKGEIPATIIGKSYNTFYSSFTNYVSCTGYFTVEQGQGDTVVLKGLAAGYDVKGVYNKTAGTVTCPAAQVIGTHPSLGPVTFYALKGGSYYRTTPVVLTFTDNKVSFDAGVYCAIVQNGKDGGVVMMKDDVTGIESNGRLKLNQLDQSGAVSASFDLPIYVTKVSDTKYEVQGLQSWLYFHNYKVPFTVNGNKATLLTTDSIDWYNSSSAGTRCLFMFGYNGTNLTADPTFTVSESNGITTFTADSKLFCGWNTEGTSYSGFYLNNYGFNYNPNGNQGGGSGEEPNDTIIGMSFNTFFDSFTNYRKAAGYFTIQKGSGANDVILKGLAQGYDVKGTYDKASRTITCPASQVIGSHPQAGTITFYSLQGEQFSRTEPVLITFNEDYSKATFNHGIYATVSQGGGLALMQNITSVASNGLLKLDQTNQQGAVQASHELPIYVTKTSDSKIEVQGLQSWLYGHDYKVPFTVNGNKATLLTTDSIDWYYSQQDGIQALFMLSFNGSNVSENPTFTVSEKDGKTVFTADSRLFCGMNTGGGNWSGFFLANYGFNFKAEEVVPDVTEITVDNIIYTLDNQKLEATAIGCTNSLTDLNLPNTIPANKKTYAVVAVGDSAFMNNSKITTASMPKSLKVLGHDAFRNARKLRELKIEDLTAWCNVWMDNGNANPLYNVFPTSESQWGKVYINGQQVSTSLTIPAGVKRISRAFYGFKSLTSVTLPDGLKVLGDQAFGNCKKLPTIVIPSSVDSIGSAFWGCDMINNIELPAGLTELGASTFYDCKALTNITIKDGLKEIKSMVFSGCTSLAELILPASMESVAGTAFWSCKALKKFTCKAVTPPTTIDNAFEDFAETCTLYVPEESIPAYKAATGWKHFMSIQKMNGSVSGIDNDSDAPALYYDLNGFRVGEKDLAPGIYIKIQGKKTTKVLVK